MPFTVKMPKLSPTMEEGTIAKWHKKEGDYVEAGDLLLEITTDKATVEHTALDEGWLRKILQQEGALVGVNEPLALFTQEENESIEHVDIKFTTEEKKAPTEKGKAEEPIETEVSKPQPVQPPLHQPAFIPAPPLEKIEEISFHKPHGKRILATPLARKLAKLQGLDLSTVKGSGPGGRITSKDLQKAQPEGLVTFGRQEAPTVPSGTYEEIPLTPMRKIIGKRLQESKSFIPHFYIEQTIDAKPMVELREQLKSLELKITFNDMIIRASALALRKHPQMNTGFNSVNQAIIQFKTIDISVAVTMEGGLITPIIRHADFKNLGQISQEARALADKARKGRLQEQDYKGGSFCISNLGMYGISKFFAVINPPQAAILAVGGISDQAIVKNGAVVPGKTLALTISADHRVVDGSLAAEFLKTLQHLLENPVSLTL